MITLGLKGFTCYGRIDHHFEDGFFPNKFNWRSRDWKWVLDGLDEYLENEGLPYDTEYVCVSYSDGATVGYLLPFVDNRCKAIIVHSGIFLEKKVWQIMDQFRSWRNRPQVFLLSNWGDRTGMGHHTDRAYEFFCRNKISVEHVRLTSRTFLGHEFTTGLSPMDYWARRTINHDLRVRYPGA